MPQQWEVFLVHNCRHAKPQPKSKFVVIAYTNPELHGFFINSEIRNFIKNRRRLFDCEALIIASLHSFLRHDSYIDCTNIYPFELTELADSRGILHSTAQVNVIIAVGACPMLPRFHKKRIL